MGRREDMVDDSGNLALGKTDSDGPSDGVPFLCGWETGPVTGPVERLQDGFLSQSADLARCYGRTQGKQARGCGGVEGREGSMHTVAGLPLQLGNVTMWMLGEEPLLLSGWYREACVSLTVAFPGHLCDVTQGPPLLLSNQQRKQD